MSRYQTLTNKEELRSKFDPTPEVHAPLISKFQYYTGIFYAAISGILFAMTSSIAKYLRALDPVELTLIRFGGCASLALVHAACRYQDILPDIDNNLKTLLLVRGLLATPAIVSAFTAIHLLPVAEATVLIFTSPIFTAILARIFMNEKFSLLRWLSVVFTILGVIFLTKLPQQVRDFHLNIDTVRHLWGCGLAILAAILMSCIYILARKTKVLNEAVSVFHYSWIASLLAAVVLCIKGNYSLPRCGSEAILLLVMIVVSFYGQFFVTKALRNSQAGSVAVVRAVTDITTTYVIQVAMFNEVPGIYAAVGTICVCVAVILITIKPVDDEVRSDK